MSDSDEIRHGSDRKRSDLQVGSLALGREDNKRQKGKTKKRHEEAEKKKRRRGQGKDEKEKTLIVWPGRRAGSVLK